MPGRTSTVADSALDVGGPGAVPAVGDGGTATSAERIAVAALGELPAGGAVLLDAGPVAEHLARLLPADCGLTVITNSMPVAVALIAREDVTVLLIGGRIQAGVGTTVGGSGATGVEGLHVDVACMAADGVSAERGLTTCLPAESAMKRMMLKAADRVVLTAPREHIGYAGLARFGALPDVDHLITDSPCDTPAGRRVAVKVQHLTRV